VRWTSVKKRPKSGRGRGRRKRGLSRRVAAKLKFYNVVQKRRVEIPSSKVDVEKRGKTLFYTARDPKTGEKLWRIKGRA